MTMKPLSRYLPLVMGLLAGCSAPVTTSIAHPGVTLSVQPAVQGGGYRTQTVVNPYGQADIYHLQVKLFKVASGVETPVTDASGNPLMKDIASPSLGVPVVFGNLNFDTTYRVRAYAYSDPATASLISTTDSGSYVDITVTNDDRPTVSTLPVQLIDKIFSGEATASGIAVSSGSVIYTGNESLTLN